MTRGATIKRAKLLLNGKLCTNCAFSSSNGFCKLRSHKGARESDTAILLTCSGWCVDQGLPKMSITWG